MELTVAQMEQDICIQPISSTNMVAHESDRNRYADLSPFVRLLGTRGRVQILDTLISKHYDALTAGEIAEYTGISESTFARNKDELLDLEMVEAIDDESGPTRYTINEDNDVVKTLVRFHLDLSEHAERILTATTPRRKDLVATLAHQSLEQETDDSSDERDDTRDFSAEVVTRVNASS